MQIRIGNQTSSHQPGELPYQFALGRQFDAFEWYSDKRGISGWCERDASPAMRRELRQVARERGVAFSVHAPAVADPMQPRGQEAIRASIEFARDTAATRVIIHLNAQHPAVRFAESLLPLVAQLGASSVQLSLENTPEIGPDYVNALFGVLSRIPEAQDRVGLCFDMGHANLHPLTRYRFVEYFDLLGAHVPVNHWHAHENWGDRDSHLTLFSGPSVQDDSGIKGLVRRLLQRGFQGSVILEQYPSPPELLVHARNRLYTTIIEATREMGSSLLRLAS